MKSTVLKYNVMIKKEGKYFVAYVPTLPILVERLMMPEKMLRRQSLSILKV